MLVWQAARLLLPPHMLFLPPCIKHQTVSTAWHVHHAVFQKAPAAATSSCEMLVPCTGARVGCSGQAPWRLKHFDHVLLGDREGLWPALRPDHVLVVGGSSVGKRLGQFLEWCAVEQAPG